MSVLPRLKFRVLVAIPVLWAAADLSSDPAAQAGSVIADVKVDADTAGLPGRLDFLEHFGGSLAGLGDLNGDGFFDLLVGSPWDSLDGKRQGLVQILSMRNDASVLGGIEIAEGLNGFVGPLDPFDYFGTAVARIGDLDGDGIEEIAVGAPGDDDGAFSEAGAVYVLFLNANGTVRSEQKISATAGGFSGSLVFLSNFGAALCGPGDLDGDGVPDLAVGAPGGDGSGAGAVWLLFLRSDGTVKASPELDERIPALASYVTSTSAFGQALASPGDLDGNGFADLFVGNPTFTGGAIGSGVVVTVLLGGAGAVLDASAFDLQGPGTGSTLSSAGFGLSLGMLGDLDSDGRIELAVGSRLAVTVGVATASEIRVVSVDPAGIASGYHLIDPQQNSVETFVGPSDDFGIAVTSIGDLDGDGVPDMAVGAQLDTSGGPAAGAVYVLQLSDGNPAAAIQPSLTRDCPPLTVGFADASSGTGLSSWSWDFGDGGTSTLAAPTHVYAAEGSYTVTLEVTGSGGKARVIEKNLIVVDNDPEADFVASVTSGSVPLSVDFTDLSSPSVISWVWTFGDGGTSFQEQNPTHVYATPGTYDVKLLVACPTGVSQEIKAGYIQVDDGMQASVTSDNGIGVNPDVFDSLSDPELGTTWLGMVDGSLLGTTGLSILYGYGRPLKPGLLLFVGELLVDPFSPLILVDVRQMPFGLAFHRLGVPTDLAFIGFAFSGQVVLTNVGGAPQLTNRLDFVLGL